MTDKELLGLAAKAAEIEIAVWSIYGAYVGGLEGDVWNPLADDGDALWLAVKLGVDLITGGGRTIAYCQGLQACEFHGDDPYAATRRAIVRAAAAIGEAQQ